VLAAWSLVDKLNEAGELTRSVHSEYQNMGGSDNSAPAFLVSKRIGAGEYVCCNKTSASYRIHLCLPVDWWSVQRQSAGSLDHSLKNMTQMA
jgi:hypothetical protein